MINTINPFENLLKCAILAGRKDIWILNRFREFGISLSSELVSKTTAKLMKFKLANDMIVANKKRLVDKEETLIDDSALTCLFSDFLDDVRFLITSFHDHDKIADFNYQKAHYLEFTKFPRLCEKVLNTLLAYSHTSVLENIFELDKSLTEQEINISNTELQKFQYFLFNTLKYSQVEISNYLKKENNFKNLNNLYDLLPDDAFDILHQSDTKKLILINENKNLFILLNDLNEQLMKGIGQFYKTINKLKEKIKSWRQVIKNHNFSFKSDVFSTKSADIETTENNFQNKTLFIPFHHLIRLFIYLGHNIKDIKSLFDQSWHNNIPMVCYEQILKKCEVIPKGKKMINENQKRRKENKNLISFDEIRETFKFPNVYDRLYIEDIDLKIETILPESNFDIRNQAMVRVIEILMTGKAELPRILNCLKDDFSTEITEKELEIFQYYFWNLDNYNNKEDVFNALYGYFFLDPQNEWFEPHQNVLLRGLNHTLFTLELINKEEILSYLEELESILEKEISMNANRGKSKERFSKYITDFLIDFEKSSISNDAQRAIDILRKIQQHQLGIDKEQEPYYSGGKLTDVEIEDFMRITGLDTEIPTENPMIIEEIQQLIKAGIDPDALYELLTEEGYSFSKEHFKPQDPEESD